MVEITRTRHYWSRNLLSNIVVMFHPEEAIINLKLQAVNKNFRKAVAEVNPLQKKQLLADQEALKPELE